MRPEAQSRWAALWPDDPERPEPPIPVRERRRRPRLLFGQPVASRAALQRQFHQPPVGTPAYGDPADPTPDERNPR
jgi:hypothetical protein